MQNGVGDPPSQAEAGDNHGEADDDWWFHVFSLLVFVFANYSILLTASDIHVQF
jgi:hypothetical protein